MTEQRVVEMIGPSVRMFPRARHKTIKQLADVEQWRVCWERVQALQREGWRIEDVTVLWRSVPGLTAERVDWLRELFGDVPIREDLAAGGHGRTQVRLVRDAEA